jgi:hypothetical protein
MAFCSEKWRHIAVGSAILLIFACAAPAAITTPDFRFDVRPILAKNCFSCHGPDEAHRQADLRLDEREGAVEVGAIAPGSPDDSELVRRVVSADADERMPPAKTGHKLTDTEIATLRAWIAGGARYSKHWSYESPQRPALPKVSRPEWCRNGIDYFALAKLEQAGLTPEPEADRYRLIRRLSLDLTGLPPTVEDVDAFVLDSRPDAYERLVDRLLASPAYGEHWARKWLDLARYADTTGYEKDSRRVIWAYRDWVINALNADMPFDKFTIEQLAGDLLPNATHDQIVATGFHRNSMQNNEGGVDNEEYRTAAVIDRVNTTMQVWMGTTIGCCQCHSHKYDPFSQQEYYKLYAFLNQTADANRADQEPLLAAATIEQQKLKAELGQQLKVKQEAYQAKADALADVQREWERAIADGSKVESAVAAPQVIREIARLAAEKRTAAQVEEITKYFRSLQPELTAIAKQREEIERRLRDDYKPDTTPIMKELPPGEQRKTHLFTRGSFMNPAEEVSAETPKVFPAMAGELPRNRLGLAKWLIDRKNPLTARVVANRHWEQLFDKGIVLTSEDFGSQGTLPSHPELLDWLAVDLMHNGWSLKKLAKTIVMSATYRQSSRISSDKLARDPDNRLLSRGPRARLSAEQIRDQALAVSGLLSKKMGGPSVMPPQPDGVWQVVYSSDRWNTSAGEDKYRRGIYTFWRRTSPYPSAMALDATSRETCTIRRVTTNTPIAAFALLNDPVYVKAARALAKKTVEQRATDSKTRANFAFRQVLGRPPSDGELGRLVELFESERANYEKHQDAAMALISEVSDKKPKVKEAPTGDVAAMAAWTVVGNVLLNLDETLTR